MQIKQFEDKNLAQYSYAILSDCEKQVMLIDPSRNPQQYLDFAEDNQAKIIGIIETHPHADFISSHLELYNITGATIYTSQLTNAHYPHQSFDEGQYIKFGKIKLTAINTPGHSPDSICILLEHEKKQKAIFTGDTLFIGDCGRPDLREEKEDIKTSRIELAKQMYHSLRDKLLVLQDDTILYPAHGAGTLCGKSLSNASSSTIGEERKTSWSLQAQSEDGFVQELLSGQPFVPAYFLYNVKLNKKGAPSFCKTIAAVKINTSFEESNMRHLKKEHWIIDTRDENDFKNGHLPNSLNLMEGAKFETWLGTIIQPTELFYLVAADESMLERMIERTAAIGYEVNIIEAIILKTGAIKEALIDVRKFKEHLENYTIVDVRNPAEVKEKKIFSQSISIPLSELRERSNEIPKDKPVVVHCAGGYRSAAASSLLQSLLGHTVKVLDLGEAVNEFR